MFNQYIDKVLKECSDCGCGLNNVGDVMGGTHGSYADGDNRIPKVLGTMQRRLKKKSKKAKSK